MVKLDSEHVLQIAMELEEAIQVCYDILANIVGRSDKSAAKLFTEMGAQEEEHFRTFNRMLMGLCTKTGRAPRMLTAQQQEYVRSLFDGGLVPDIEAMRRMAAKTSFADAFNLAMRSERDSIAFYTGMLLGITQDQDIEAVRMIIDEEKKHEQELLALRESMLSTF